MKFSFDIKNKKAGLETDLEKIVEKGIEEHERNWKDKFNTKHNAKKEIQEIKHKHKIESREKKEIKKTRYQIKQEEIRKNKEQEFRQGLIIIAIALGIFTLFMIICFIGAALEG